MLQWIELARQGDRAAFDRIVRHYAAMAYAIAYGKLRDAHMAEDAVQESFAEAFVHLRKLKEPAAFPGWLKAIVTRQCHRLLRRKRYPTMPLDEAAQTAHASEDVADIVEKRDLSRKLRDGVAALTPNMRTAVEWFYFHGYSLQEISDCLNTPVPVLKKRLFDARRKLKGTLPVADFVSVFQQLYEGGTKVLHIVNGDSVAERLRQGVVHGDILVWRELYSEGPVFPDPAEAASRTARAHYLEKALGIPAAEFIRISEGQEKALDGCKQYEEIVLWFEHDLFDQTMLCHLLHRFARRPLGRTKLSLLCIGAYPGVERFRGLGQLTAEQLQTLSGTWQPVGPEQLKLGAALWEAYSSPDPGKLVRLLREDTGALPFAGDAFRLHLARFPSARNGLGIIEQATLEEIHGGAHAPVELFERVGGRLHGLGLGDLQYWRCLAGLAQAPNPLIRIGGSPPIPAYNAPSPSFRHSRIELTEAGSRVMTGEADAVALNGIDAWYGGVYLQGRLARWRWDASRNTIVAAGQSSG